VRGARNALNRREFLLGSGCLGAGLATVRAGIVHGAIAGTRSEATREVALHLIEARPQPVLGIGDPDAAGNQFGFEGGCAFEHHGAYHLFTTEMVGRPFWVRTRLAHWTSPDLIHWRRQGTLFESSGECRGQDPRAALWAPMPIYDEGERRWYLFYVAYRCLPNQPGKWLTNISGHIWRAVSEHPGPDGLGGPYRDLGVIMQPDSASQSWEGVQGVDSFFPYRVGREWLAIYGSAQTDTPAALTRVGLARSPTLGGPWRRATLGNPLPIEGVFIENPIVHRLERGGFIAIYDSDVPHCFGYSISADGMHWSRGLQARATASSGAWTTNVRTPLGLMPVGQHRVAVLYTGYRNVRTPFPDTREPGDSAVGLAYFELRDR